MMSAISDGNNLGAPASGPSRRQLFIGFAVTLGGLALGPARVWAQAEGEISHTAEAIHQEPVIKAGPKRVYEALTETAQFDKVIELSGVMKSMQNLGNKPTQISREVGGAFTLFGGYVRGDMSNSSLVSALCRRGEPAVGTPACIRLRNSNWWSKAPEPRSFLTTRASPKARRNIWLPDGKSITGSRSRNCWLE